MKSLILTILMMCVISVPSFARDSEQCAARFINGIQDFRSFDGEMSAPPESLDTVTFLFENVPQCAINDGFTYQLSVNYFTDGYTYVVIVFDSKVTEYYVYDNSRGKPSIIDITDIVGFEWADNYKSTLEDEFQNKASHQNLMVHTKSYE
jgi:hypothetical protein